MQMCQVYKAFILRIEAIIHIGCINRLEQVTIPLRKNSLRR